MTRLTSASVIIFSRPRAVAAMAINTIKSFTFPIHSTIKQPSSYVSCVIIQWSSTIIKKNLPHNVCHHWTAECNHFECNSDDSDAVLYNIQQVSGWSHWKKIIWNSFKFWRHMHFLPSLAMKIIEWFRVKLQRSSNRKCVQFKRENW